MIGRLFSLLIGALLFIIPEVFSAEFVEVQIDNVERKDLIHLHEAGANIDGVWGTRARAYIPQNRLEEFRQMGYDLTVISDQIRKDSKQTDNYPSHSELTNDLKTVEAEHPGICRLYNIGLSGQGRELWFMKISDNPDAAEDEPECKYIAAMHGDEPVGMMLCLNLIHLLTDEYGTDSRITALLNETEIWIMPLMNPDGYMNLTRENAAGYDLNRTFPDRLTDPVNAPEGRPVEVQHMMNWADDHSAVLSANFHAGAMVVNYPYDSDPNPLAFYAASPDDALFIQQSLTYSSRNQPMYDSPYFEQGITNGAAWYFIDGGMQDWNYVWMGCNEVTIELSDIKWPLYSDIPDLWEDNRESMLAYLEWSLKGIRGLVTDSATGLPLNATVSVIGIDHNVYTDPDAGDYHRMLLPGTYSLRFSATGYESKTLSDIVVTEGDAARLDVSLKPQIPGDVDDDGHISLADAVLIARVLSGVNSLLLVNADVNQDGKIGTEEAVFVLRRLSVNHETHGTHEKISVQHKNL
jgi:carboxypeptidase D